MATTPKPTFWVTNFSKRDVALSDLGITIKAMSSVNLLDAKHYPHITLAMLERSEVSGSMHKKRDKINHRKVPPESIPKERIQVDTQAVLPIRARSILEIKHEQYEELNIVDDDIVNNLTNQPPAKK